MQLKKTMNYLQVNYDGSIFEYSKEEQEGFVKHENTVGKISYRKYYNKGVSGNLIEIKKENNQYKNNAEELKVYLEDVAVTYCLTFPILNQDGTSIDEYMESFSLILPKMKLGSNYNINNWMMKKGDVINGDEVKYTKKGVTVKENGNKIKSNLTFEYVEKRGTPAEKHVKGDVPMLVWKELAGKNRPTAASKEKRLEFLYSLIEDNIGRIKGGESNASEINNEDDNDLPF